jgi:hypothetical protein
MNSVNEQPPTRMRRRDRLRSFAHSTSSALRQEINRYYSPPRPRSIASSEESNPEEIKRIDEFLEGSVPEIVQPQCMLFPTYAKQVNEQDGETQWKMTLGGWTFAKPGAGRLDRWLLGLLLW